MWCKQIILLLLVALAFDYASHKYLIPTYYPPPKIEEKPKDADKKYEVNANSTFEHVTNIPVDKKYEVYAKSTFEHVTIEVELCQSCGYKKLFDDLKTNLTRIFPKIVMTSKEFPLPQNSQMLSYGILAFQVIMGLLITVGDTVFAKLGITPPQIYETIKAHKMMAGMMVFMFGNMMKTYVTNTGAFEVFINGMLSYSAISLKRVPTVDALASMVINYI